VLIKLVWGSMLPEEDSCEQEVCVDFSLRPEDSRQQRSLRSCGFINVAEQQVGTAMVHLWP
jgi:hypothetical protein